MKIKRAIRKFLGCQTKAHTNIQLRQRAEETGQLLINGPLEFRPEVDVEKDFDALRNSNPPVRVLEIGTLQARPGLSTHLHARFPDVSAENYVKGDIQEGPDVDVVCDIHALPESWTASFDCFVASAVFEHLERPWIAAREVARVLKPGGIFFVATHQCFPIHGFPSDFFRFSREALRLIFEDAGLVVTSADYEGRCVIVPPRAILEPSSIDSWNEIYPSYILVKAAGAKPKSGQPS